MCGLKNLLFLMMMMMLIKWHGMRKTRHRWWCAVASNNNHKRDDNINKILTHEEEWQCRRTCVIPKTQMMTPFKVFLFREWRKFPHTLFILSNQTPKTSSCRLPFALFSRLLEWCLLGGWWWWKKNM